VDINDVNSPNGQCRFHKPGSGPSARVTASDAGSLTCGMVFSAQERQRIVWDQAVVLKAEGEAFEVVARNRLGRST
jgi:hypothetical protein